ncbi:hypothetical protein ACFQ3N_14940 [Virgibacillus byunsanensis]|uniref:Uncharacterized protein n=1 Tax=Virgibacillus byunsanensis TaxID=570945 RepID=A0ABW3LMS9_9BACI
MYKLTFSVILTIFLAGCGFNPLDSDIVVESNENLTNAGIF